MRESTKSILEEEQAQREDKSCEDEMDAGDSHPRSFYCPITKMVMQGAATRPISPRSRTLGLLAFCLPPLRARAHRLPLSRCSRSLCTTSLLPPLSVGRGYRLDPVMDPEGNSYERTAIEDWLSRNPVSPVTRSALWARDLVPDRALREAIEHALGQGAAVAASAAAAAASAADVAADRGIGLTLCAMPTPGGPSDELTVLATVQPPVGAQRTPSDVCCVVDVSGSMGAADTMQNASGGFEAHDLSLLDVVKHAVTTIISVLEPTDRLSLVVYSSEARVVFDLIPMDDAGKARAKRELGGLHTGGQTNLWDGLHTGLEVLRRGCEDGSNRLSSVLLLTAGQPNICPPRGHLPMLRRYKDQNLRLSATISTFGFGYRLDSELLRDIASEGDGMYAFIPNSDFVGTAFVNAASNLLVTMGRNAGLMLEPADGVTLVPASILGGVPTQETSWGAHLRIGSLQYGQHRSFLARVKIPADMDHGIPYLTATLRCQTRHDPEPLTTTVDAMWTGWDASVLAATVQLTHERMRLMLVDHISEAVATVKGGGVAGGQAIIARLEGQLRAAEPRTANLEAMLADVEKHITEAISRQDWYCEWGRHYLPSLARAHQLQQCNNFKDPGIQQYGGELFKQLRDHTDELFCKLPPPRLSACGGGMYNNRSHQCFAGHCALTQLPFCIETWYKHMIDPNHASTPQTDWSVPARLHDAPSWVRDLTRAMDTLNDERSPMPWQLDNLTTTRDAVAGPRYPIITQVLDNDIAKTRAQIAASLGVPMTRCRDMGVQKGISYLTMVHAQPSPTWKDLGVFWEHKPTRLQCAQKRLAFAMTLRSSITQLVVDMDVASLVGNAVVTCKRTDPRVWCRRKMRNLGFEHGCKWLAAEWCLAHLR